MLKQFFKKYKKIVKGYSLILIGSVLFVHGLATIHTDSKSYSKKEMILKGRELVFKSGCIRCHSFIAGKQIKGIDSLADFGNRHLTIKETMEAIRSCKMDIYCSERLTNKQVKYIAYYLNSLKNKKDSSPLNIPELKK